MATNKKYYYQLENIEALEEIVFSYMKDGFFIEKVADVVLMPDLPEHNSFAEISDWLTTKLKKPYSVNAVKYLVSGKKLQATKKTVYCELWKQKKGAWKVVLVEPCPKSSLVHYSEKSMNYSANFLGDYFKTKIEIPLGQEENKRFELPTYDFIRDCEVMNTLKVSFYRKILDVNYITKIELMRFMVKEHFGVLEDLEIDSALSFGIKPKFEEVTQGVEVSKNTLINSSNFLDVDKLDESNEGNIRDGLEEPIAQKLYTELLKEKYIAGGYQQQWQWLKQRNELACLIRKLKLNKLIKRDYYEGVLQYIVDIGTGKKELRNVEDPTDYEKIKLIENLVNNVKK